MYALQENIDDAQLHKSLDSEEIAGFYWCSAETM